MPRYVDGFVIPISSKKIAAYKKIARLAGKVWREHGAEAYFECVGDDLKCGDFAAPFSQMAGLKKGETVLFSWIVYKSKAHRNKVNAKVMKDKRIEQMMKPGEMPFDCKRMAMGGFKVLVEM